MKKYKLLLLIMLMTLTLSVMMSCGSSEAEESVDLTPPQETEKVDEIEGESNSDIGYEGVVEIVLAKVPGATEDDIYEFEKEFDDGRLEYEGSLYYDGYEYEFEIDGATGNLLQWEIDD
ncbi:MAG: PepSY domain-containing protein [Bacillota bacterium]|nr:PepSY domain-containing protein [Bacillota bacterium]